MRMNCKAYATTRLSAIATQANLPTPEVINYYHSTLVFLYDHTSLFGAKAVLVALNETQAHFIGAYSL